jgi:hypothetical protein
MLFTEHNTRTVVVLDSELSAIFVTPDAVNKVLRALVKTMPKRTVDRKNNVLRAA